MTGVLRAFGLDMRRLGSQGVWNLLFVTVAIPVALVLISVLGGGLSSSLSSSMVVGCLVGAFAVMPMNVFGYERQGGHGRMNGVIPVRRLGQVAGRYLLLGVLAVVLFLECLICQAAVQLSSGRPLTLDAPVVAVLAVASYAVIEAVMVPLLYRFPVQRALMVLSAGVVGFGVVAAFAIWLRSSSAPAMSFIGHVARSLSVFASSAAGGTVLVLSGVVAACVVAAVSFIVSVRVYQGEDL